MLEPLGGVSTAKLGQPLDAGDDAGPAVRALAQADRWVSPQVAVQQAAHSRAQGCVRPKLRGSLWWELCSGQRPLDQLLS